MKKFFTITSIVFMISAFYLPSYGQLNAEGLKFGVQFNGLLPFDDFYNSKGFSDSYLFSFLGRGFIRFDLTKTIQAELGGGYGQYQGKDNADLYNVPAAKYLTEIIPIDFRVLFAFAESENWSPYFFFGGGALHYNVKYYDSPNAYDFQNPQETVKEDGWAAIVPVGLGTRIKLAETVLFEIQANFTYAFTEDLNHYKIAGTPDDAYAGLGLGLTFQGDRGTSDDDMDGLMKKEEKLLGTDPKNPDTDADGLKDGEEVNKYKTNPLKADTDGDALTDGDEVQKYKTDPIKSDTDGDGLNDKDELMQYKTDPLKADTDGDALNDADEINKYKTDPLKTDTEGDLLNDGQEVNQYKTDPLKADTDGDGLKDGEEVSSFKTDPLKKDTDGGTVDDGVELKRGTNPLDPADDVVKIGVPMVLEGITFATNKSDVLPESEKVLMGALKTLQTYPDILVEISGHTDNVGSNSSNQKLSQRRADAVKAWLVSKGIAPDRISAVGYGEESPRVANDTSENKRLNRRIEFKRVK